MLWNFSELSVPTPFSFGIVAVAISQFILIPCVKPKKCRWWKYDISKDIERNIHKIFILAGHTVRVYQIKEMTHLQMIAKLIVRREACLNAVYLFTHTNLPKTHICSCVVFKLSLPHGTPVVVVLNYFSVTCKICSLYQRLQRGMRTNNGFHIFPSILQHSCVNSKKDDTS